MKIGNLEENSVSGKIMKENFSNEEANKIWKELMNIGCKK